MALRKRTDIRRVSAAAVFAAATLNASPLYLAVLSEQTASDAAWLAVAETLADRHGGEIITYTGSAFSETLRQALAARQPDYVCFVAQPQEVTQAFVAGAHQMLRELDADPYGDAVWGVVTGLTATDAQMLANKAGPLVIRKALMKTAGDWSDYSGSGMYKRALVNRCKRRLV